MAEYCIGTSGWHYEHWRGRFYPLELSKAGWLGYYARHFGTVELNYSFYQLPSEDAFSGWREATPPRFTFAVKVSRFITHVKRLRDNETTLEIFLGRARILAISSAHSSISYRPICRVTMGGSSPS